MTKNIIITLCLIAFSTLNAISIDSLNAQKETLPGAENAFTQFSTLMNWFILALILITLISIIRMIVLKRKNNNNKDKPKVDLQPPQNQKNAPVKKSPFSLPLIIMLILLMVIIFHSFSSSGSSITKESYSNFMARVANGQITQVQFAEKDIFYTDVTNKKFSTTLPFENPQLVDSLVALGIKVSATKPSRWAGIISYLLPFLLLIVFWVFFLRGMNAQNAKAFSFGKSKARLYEASKTGITFKDVAGVDEAKEELQEIVEFLKDPKKFQRLGGRIPRGVLLVGQPGTGKTLLAKAVSGEAGVPFFSISGSDFVEMFVGVGAARVRDLFDQAKKNAPCITFIDEIDAVGRHRGSGLGGGHDEREQTLNQLLVEMDGFEPNEAVIIIAATNRPDILDPALLRPGRFDRRVTVDLPDIKGRTEILRVHTTKVPLANDVHLELIARGTPGFSGADLANLVNEAALIAASKNKSQIQMDDFEEAKDKLILGKEKKSRVIPEEDKRLTAYHEIGHVLTSVFLEKTEPVHKVSIIPRGFTGGATHYLMTDKSNYSKSYLLQMLITLLGGRAAEEVVFNEFTTGAGNDLERCTDITKKMVCSWGMSDKIGPMTIGKEQGEIFLGKELVSRDVFSEETSQLVDREIRDIINNAYAQAISLLTAHRKLMEIMAKELQEKETLGTDEIFSL
ncbi:MAG TPA: ATP-dependent zinc metalloprotease FtsH, partial [Candidatus Cloacimonas sp.]|nr:ATP-dependent zinc metalloprotease FtsH [Candidatus Cloacimonas sp.]